MEIEEKDFNFINHGSFDVSNLKKLIENLNEEWNENSERQEKTFSQKNTKSITIVQFPLNWIPEKMNTHQEGLTEEYDPKIVFSNKEIVSEINLIIKSLEEKLDGKVGRVLLTKLLAGKNIFKHKDYQKYLVLNNRCHIPIITNDRVAFAVGDETLNMKVGECWEINNSRIHSVTNSSDEDRVHLIVDIIPNKYF